MENSSPNNAQIHIFAKQLRLPTIGNYEKVIRQMDPTAGYESFLLEILKQEVTHRQENQQKRRLRIAGFPNPKTLDEFDYSRLEHVRQEYIWELASCDYIKRRENIIMIGNTGMGKSHISIGLGMRACKEGFNVKFITAANLVNMLSEARDSYRLNKLEKSFQKFDLLIIDELSYLTFNRHHSELLFQVIAERSEKASIIVSTNLQFSEWTDIFENEKMVAAMIDRLTFRSHILNMNGDSYRLEERKRKMKPA